MVDRKKIINICRWLIPITFVYVQLSTTLPRFRNLQVLKCTHWSDAACTILFWKGEPLDDLQKDEKIEATVVISYCGGDMSTFTKYIDDKSEYITIRDVAIIPGCPETSPSTKNIAYKDFKVSSQWQPPIWQQIELHFMEWLIAHLEAAMAHSLPDYYDDDNHVIIFLSSRVLDLIDQRRPLDTVVQSAMENRFGCVQKPSNGMSYYHDRNALRHFTNSELNETRQYNFLGEWIDGLSASWIFDGLVPVCYGDSFALNSRDLSRNSGFFHGVLKAMITEYKAHESYELVEFMERSLAALFSRRLAQEQIISLKEYSTQVHTGQHLTGALYHSWRNHGWLRVFKGDTLEKKDIDLSQLRLTLVVSYCMEDMTWMNEYFKDLRIGHVTIISKCIEPIKGFNPPGATISRMSNTGRCDHSYASWMANMKEDATDNHIVLFIKASRYLYQSGMHYRPIRDVIRIANERGFSCEAEASDKSSYYRTELLRGFSLPVHRGVYVKSPYRNMGHWLDNMGIELPGPLTPVCYGGNFAAKASQIYSKKKLWEKMATSLSRGDSIEEGHFAERAWAGILSYLLNSNETAIIQSIPIIYVPPSGGYMGAVHLNE